MEAAHLQTGWDNYEPVLELAEGRSRVVVSSLGNMSHGQNSVWTAWYLEAHGT